MGRTVAWKSTSRFLAEEVLNQWTHGIGFALSLPAGWWLLHSAAQRQNPGLLVACGIYCFSLSLLYAASTLSHSVHRGIWRHRFRTLDQVAIFLFIAGSYTAFDVAFPRAGWWDALLAVMWLLAIIGIVLKVFFTRLYGVAVWFYALIGWLPILAMPHLFRCVGQEGVAWIFAGGAAYSLGTWFLTNDERPYFHPIWHVLVILGSACHYILMLKYVVPVV